MSRERVTSDVGNRNFTSVFHVRPSFRAKLLRLKFHNWNSTPVFDTGLCERAPSRPQNSHFTTRLRIREIYAEGHVSQPAARLPLPPKERSSEELEK
jgi:hypothetical protein